MVLLVRMGFGSARLRIVSARSSIHAVTAGNTRASLRDHCTRLTTPEPEFSVNAALIQERKSVIMAGATLHRNVVVSEMSVPAIGPK